MNRDTAAAALFTGMIITGVTLYRRTIERPFVPPAQDHILFVDEGPVEFDSTIGHIRLRVATGYFGVEALHLPVSDIRRERKASTAIFMYVDGLTSFPHELAERFRTATDGHFQLEPAPDSSSGGGSTAVAIISAGTNYNAYCDERSKDYKGYFKCTTAPDLNQVVDILQQLVGLPQPSLATKTVDRLRPYGQRLTSAVSQLRPIATRS